MKKIINIMVTTTVLATFTSFGGNLLDGGNAENGNIWNPAVEISKEIKKSGQAAFRFDKDPTVIKTIATIPVDINKKYRISGFLKSHDANKLSITGMGIVMLDSGKKSILRSNVDVRPESDTVLAKAASKGDNSIFIADGSKWQRRRSVRTQVAFKTKPDLSDLPNFNVSSLIERVIKKKDGTYEVKLKAPLMYNFPAGTPVRQHYYGQSQFCVASYNKIPAEWKEYKAELTGEASSGAPVNKFWKGTKFIQIFIIPNAGRNGSNLFFDDICFEEVK